MMRWYACQTSVPCELLAEVIRGRLGYCYVEMNGQGRLKYGHMRRSPYGVGQVGVALINQISYYWRCIGQ